MKTKTLTSTCLSMILIFFFSVGTNAQIPLKGLAIDNEGIACWDADGNGPEPEAYGHTHPYGWGSSLYYAASRDYVNNNPDAAMSHFVDNISGFPLFEQALEDNGFIASQVKMRYELSNMKNDKEGEDWFTFNNTHYYNRYGGHYFIELNGEPMISGFVNFNHILITSSGSTWICETNFTTPTDISEGSSLEIKEVAQAFLTDLGSEELRIKINCTAETNFTGNGRIGAYFNITSGSLEKGFPELSFSGLAINNEGIAAWDADGSGPEPAANGHSFEYGGQIYGMFYYLASRDYDGIDPNVNAAFLHFSDDNNGFPNLGIQMAYRGYSMDQLKIKSGIGTLGSDTEGVDWGLNGSIHWYNFYGFEITIEIAGEPILEYFVDTTFSFNDLDNNDNWWCNASYSKVRDISANASDSAKAVAYSLINDLGGNLISSYMEGNNVGEMPALNGRSGVFQQLENGKLLPGIPNGTHVWEGDVRGTWSFEKSPYIVMGEINVPDGEMLIIEPGVEVKFNTTETFAINGCLFAEGTEESPILFTTIDESVPWGGIGWISTLQTNETSILKHCILEHSYAYNPDTIYGYNCGGAIRIYEYDNIEISHCKFRYNTVDNFTSNNPAGGALAISECSLHISHCIFYDNSGSWGGAIGILSNAEPVFDNCLFYNNMAPYSLGGGGAVLSWTNCYPHFVNCTFADNDAADAGGAVELEFGGEASFTNCIFWGNSAGNVGDQISVWDPDISFLNVYYCDIEEGLNGITPGFQGDYIGNIDEDPLFVGLGEHPYQVADVSPCVNAGSESALYLPENYIFPEYCLFGNERIWNSIVDIGCFEYNDLTGLKKLSIDDHYLKIYPNPVINQSAIEFYMNDKAFVDISIIDLNGKLIMKVLGEELDKGQHTVDWQTNLLSPGIYFCKLQSGSKTIVRKLVKLH